MEASPRLQAVMARQGIAGGLLALMLAASAMSAVSAARSLQEAALVGTQLRDDELHDNSLGDGASCPAWLDEYAAWHKANKGAPNATYLVQFCPDNREECNGIGDRIRGIMVLLRLAYVHKKVLLVVWNWPEPLQKYLAPHGIDWTTDGLPQDVLDALHTRPESPFDIHNHINRRRMDALLTMGEGAEEFRQEEVVRTQLLYWPGTTVMGSTDKEFMKQAGRTQFARCLMQFLFKPSALLEEASTKQLQAMLGNKPHPYMSWHWRQGGQVDEMTVKRSNRHRGKDELNLSKLRTFVSVEACARNLSKSIGAPDPQQHPVVLVTDHSLIRDYVSQGSMRAFTSTHVTVVHSNSKRMDSSANLALWVDIMLLARSDCIIYSSSGYSNVALWMSNTQCYKHFAQCVEDDSARFEGVPM